MPHSTDKPRTTPPGFVVDTLDDPDAPVPYWPAALVVPPPRARGGVA